jgi:hypothetical protein
MGMHYVKTCPILRYVVTLHGFNCYIAALQQCKCTIKFGYIYVNIIQISDVITVIIFELITHTAYNLCGINHKNADFGFYYYFMRIQNINYSDYIYRIT